MAASAVVMFYVVCRTSHAVIQWEDVYRNHRRH
jgi:hypothetical protein